MRWKLLAIVALLAGGSLAVAASLGLIGGTASAATTYLTAAATVADVVDDVAATGTIAPATTWGLGFGYKAHTGTASSGNGTGDASITWPVQRVSVKVGDRVTKGQVLAIANPANLQSQIDDALRSVQTADIQLAQAQDQLDAATTTDATRQATVGLYSAQTADARATSTLASFRAEAAFSSLKAPAAGIVTAVNISAGSDAPSGDAITIAGGSLQVTTSVVESDISTISLGQPAIVTIAALDGATVQGTVASISPTASSGGSSDNNGVVSFDVVITLLNPPDGLRSGMSADVAVTTASATGVLAIPSRALLGSAGSYRVRVLATDGTVATRDVTVGLITSSLAEIKSGLQAGDVVITGTSSQQSTTTRGQGGGGFVGGGTGPNVQVVRP
jgi:macrolide-specific efflux system membrane fusion protein